LNLTAYVSAIQRRLDAQPTATIFVATDDESSLIAMRTAFGSRVVAYDSIRHMAGVAAGNGPTGWIMPAYIAGDRTKQQRTEKRPSLSTCY
jgi:hypothetical protein